MTFERLLCLCGSLKVHSARRFNNLAKVGYERCSFKKPQESALLFQSDVKKRKKKFETSGPFRLREIVKYFAIASSKVPDSPQSLRISPRLLHHDQQCMLLKRTVMLLIGYLHNLANSFCLLFFLSFIPFAKCVSLLGVAEALYILPKLPFHNVSLALPEGA